jgi:hypothetical protein
VVLNTDFRTSHVVKVKAAPEESSKRLTSQFRRLASSQRCVKPKKPYII